MVLYLQMESMARVLQIVPAVEPVDPFGCKARSSQEQELCEPMAETASIQPTIAVVVAVDAWLYIIKGLHSLRAEERSL
jgi:hypothetical protein